jgi:hypothetical protein
MNLRTNIFYFKKDGGDAVKLKDCNILKSFIYNRNNFTLLEKNNFYWVCTNNKNDDLCSIWSKYKFNNENEIKTNEILSIFRKEYDKNKITKELIEKFLESPLKHTLLKVKKRRKN